MIKDLPSEIIIGPSELRMSVANLGLYIASDIIIISRSGVVIDMGTPTPTSFQ